MGVRAPSWRSKPSTRAPVLMARSGNKNRSRERPSNPQHAADGNWHYSKSVRSPPASEHPRSHFATLTLSTPFMAAAASASNAAAPSTRRRGGSRLTAPSPPRGCTGSRLVHKWNDRSITCTVRQPCGDRDGTFARSVDEVVCTDERYSWSVHSHPVAFQWGLRGGVSVIGGLSHAGVDARRFHARGRQQPNSGGGRGVTADSELERSPVRIDRTL